MFYTRTLQAMVVEARSNLFIMRKKLTKIEIIDRFNKIHNFKYSYNLINYINVKSKIIIICPIHGEFKQRTDHHLSGHACLECGKDKLADLFRLSVKEVIYKFRLVHGNKYDYSKIDYKNCKTNIIINCLYHGDFSQQPANHLMGMGCPSCGYFFSGIGKLENLINDPIKAKTPTKLYLAKLSSIDELFYKVGITSQKFNYRFRSTDYYNCEIIKYINMGLLEARNEEVKFHNQFKEFKYNPKMHFQGHTECFRSDIFNVLFPK